MFLENPDEARTFAFKVSKKEVLYISDSCTRMVFPQPMHLEGLSLRSSTQSALMHVSPKFIAKLGKAVAFLTYSEYVTDVSTGRRKKKEVNAHKKFEIELTEFEMWQVWELAQSFVRVGSTRVGYDLKVRLAQALYGEDTTSRRLLESVEALDED